jgi:hypothetical protein
MLPCPALKEIITNVVQHIYGLYIQFCIKISLEYAYSYTDIYPEQDSACYIKICLHVMLELIML